jgi:hypothetical protein
MAFYVLFRPFSCYGCHEQAAIFTQQKDWDMKGLMKSTLCFIAIVFTGTVQAHELVRIQTMTTTSGTGYAAKKLVWHADGYGGAQPYQGKTNWGPWSVFPSGQSKVLAADDWIGPVVVNKWYRVRWHFIVPVAWSMKVFAHADICGVTKPPKRDQ